MAPNLEPQTSNLDFTGWRLADAQVELKNVGCAVQIVETAPPFQKRGFTQVWGEMRVLRCAEKEGAVELVVARELLKELKAPELKVSEPETSD